MIKKILLFSLITISFVGCKCDCETSSNEVENEKTQATPFDAWTNDLQTIVVSNEGILRGIDLGTPASEIKKESAALENQDKNYAYFQSDLNQIEFFDVEYSFLEDSISAIELEVYAATADRAPELYVELESYFNERFGKNLYGLNDYQIWNTTTAKGQKVALGLRFEIPIEAESVPRVKITAEIVEW